MVIIREKSAFDWSLAPSFPDCARRGRAQDFASCPRYRLDCENVAVSDEKHCRGFAWSADEGEDRRART
jgi:hypothetical protein